MTFWLNGEWREDGAAIGIADRGFLLGDGVFETVLMRHGVAAFLEEHLDRLRRGLETMRIEAMLPEDVPELLADLAARNDLAEETAAARITVSRGVSGRGLVYSGEARPTVLMTVAAAAVPDTPAALIVSGYRRAECSVTSRCKTLAYPDNILARDEAREKAADEALMLNGAGRIACASSANVFLMRKDGAVVTPSVGEGALPGIVRALLLEEGGQAGADIREDVITPDEIGAGAVFLTNSLIGLRPAFLAGHSPQPTDLFNRLFTWYEDRLRQSLEEGAQRS